MVLTVIGNPTKFSVCTLRVITILKEKGVPFEFKSVGPPDVQTEDYVDRLHPFRQIPVLDDDGYILYESRAIGRYIAAKYAGTGTPNLIPTGNDLKEVATFEKAMSIEATQFTAAELLTYEIIFKQFNEAGGPNEEVVNRWTKQLNKRLDAYERILSKTRYLGGDHITLADLFHLPYAELLTTQVIPGVLTSPSRPNVERWWKDISSRESWQSVKDGYTPNRL